MEEIFYRSNGKKFKDKESYLKRKKESENKEAREIKKVEVERQTDQKKENAPGQDRIQNEAWGEYVEERLWKAVNEVWKRKGFQIKYKWKNLSKK